MKLKQTVKIYNLTPQLLLGLFVADGIYRRNMVDDMVVTSVDDSVHGAGTLHGQGLAADLRIRNIPGRPAVDRIVTELKESLPGFDIVLESDHIHIEYQPK